MNVTLETIKLLEENIEHTLTYIIAIFLGICLKEKETKAKINKERHN